MSAVTAASAKVSFRHCFTFASAHVLCRRVALSPIFPRGHTIAKLRLTRCYNSVQIPYLKASQAADVDKDLMENFSLDVLMELAGLSVAQAVYKVYPHSKGRRVLVVCGPGNNGGDGLVASRHLSHAGYNVTVYYPKPGKKELYQKLCAQLKDLDVKFEDDFQSAISNTDHIVDAIFGFSFSGEIREPFPGIIEAIKESKLPVTSVDTVSGWDVENGPPSTGPAKDFHPTALVSLTAPKPSAKFFKGRHFVGGRFMPKKLQEKYGLQLDNIYQGIDQVAEISAGATEKL